MSPAPILHPKAFYFIRHGESVWNVEQKFAGGRVDTPLTQKGMEQAISQINLFEKLNPLPTHIIHSPLSRAKKTASIINQNAQLPMIENFDLREIDAGEWEGRYFKDALDDWSKGKNPENGESLSDFAKRVGHVLNNILNNDLYPVPFIAAHGRLINALDDLYGLRPRPFQLGNCEILQFVPAPDKNYPWDIYTITIKNGQISKDLAAWSQ